MRPPVLLVLRALGLGDFLTGVPAYRALKDAFPEHRMVLAAPEVLEPLAGLTGAIDEVLPSRPLQPLLGRIPPPEIAVNLHGRGPQSSRILADLNPGRLLAFTHGEVPQTAGLPEWRAEEHEVCRWCRLLQDSGVSCDRERLDLEVPRLRPDLAGATVIHPGAAREARRWPVEGWAEVARHEAGHGRKVVVTGGPEERHLAERLARLAGLPADAILAGSTDLLTLASVLAGAGRLLSADTGVAHLATATRTPSVVLFGPTSPHGWGPPPDRPWHVALWKGGAGDPLANRRDPGLMAIGVDEVLAALESLPDRQPVIR